MVGCQAAPARRFYDFCIDDHIPAEHLLRGMDRHLELDSVREQLKPSHGSTGRPGATRGAQSDRERYPAPPKGREVRCRVRGSEQDQHVVVEILDQGPGIPAADEKRVLERFFRGPKPRGHGSGLGLSIVQMALDRLEGNLVLERSAPWFVARASFPR